MEPLSPVQDYFDKTSSHPNLQKRRESLRLSSGGFKSGKLFLQDEATFYQVRKWARYEMIKEEIARREYGNSLYNSLVMREEEGANLFLDLAIGKALYGLANYKLREMYHLAARSYNQMPGESQRVHYFFKQLDKKQLSVIALRYLLTLKDVYPDEPTISPLIRKLCRSMKVHGRLDWESLVDDVEFDEHKVFDLADYKNEREMIRAKQKYFYNFHAQLLVNEKNSGWLRNAFQEHQATFDSVDVVRNSSHIAVAKAYEKEQKRLSKEGSSLRLRKLAMVGPFVNISGDNLNKNIKKILAYNDDIDVELSNWQVEKSIKLNIQGVSKILEKKTEGYNEYVEYMSYVKESMYHYPLKQISHNHQCSAAINDGVDAIIYVSYNYNYNKKMGNYNFIVINSRNGFVLYNNHIAGSKLFSSSKVIKQLKKDLFTITN